MINANRVAMVITTFDARSNLEARFQVYDIEGEGHTHLVQDSYWSTEAGGIAAFDTYFESQLVK